MLDPVLLSALLTRLRYRRHVGTLHRLLGAKPSSTPSTTSPIPPNATSLLTKIITLLQEITSHPYHDVETEYKAQPANVTPVAPSISAASTTTPIPPIPHTISPSTPAPPLPSHFAWSTSIILCLPLTSHVPSFQMHLHERRSHLFSC